MANSAAQVPIVEATVATSAVHRSPSSAGLREHRRIGQVVLHVPGIHSRIGLAKGFHGGKHHQRREANEDPGPGPHGVVHDVEQEGGAGRMPLVAGREDPLHHVSAAARLGAGVVGRPPLHAERQQEGREQRVEGNGGRIGKERHLRGDLGPGHKRRQPTHLGQADEVGRRGRRSDHRHRELHEIGEEHASETAHHGIRQCDARGRGHRDERREAEQHAADLDRGERDVGHDQHVEQYAEVGGPKPAEPGGGSARVAEFVELDVGPHAAPPPEAGEEEEGGHTFGKEKRPVEQCELHGRYHPRVHV